MRLSRPMTMSHILYDAIVRGRFRQVQYLVNSGIPLDGTDSPCSLVAALHIVNGRTRDRFFRFLLNSGADYNCFDGRTGRNVLSWACLLERTNEVKTLLSFAPGDIDMDARDFGGHAALHHSVSTGSVPLVRLLLKHLIKYGLSADVAAQNGLTPYQYAQKLGFRDIADVLRNEGFASMHRISIIGALPRITEEQPRYVSKDALRKCIAGDLPLQHRGFACQRQLELSTEAKQNVAEKVQRKGHVRFVGLRLRKPEPKSLKCAAKSLDSGMQTHIKFHSEAKLYGRISSNASRRITQVNRELCNINLPSMIDAVSLEMSPSFRAPVKTTQTHSKDFAVRRSESNVHRGATSHPTDIHSIVLAAASLKRKAAFRQSISSDHDAAMRHPTDTVRSAVEKFKSKNGAHVPHKEDA